MKHPAVSSYPLCSSPLGNLISTQRNLVISRIGSCFNNSVETMLSYIPWSLPSRWHFLSGFGFPEHPNSGPLNLLYINKNKTKNIREIPFQGVSLLSTKKDDFIVVWEQTPRIKYTLVFDFWASVFWVIFSKNDKNSTDKKRKTVTETRFTLLLLSVVNATKMS